MKKMIMMACLLTLGLFTQISQAGSMKVGVVDYRSIMQQTQLRKTFMGEFKDIQKQNAGKTATIRKEIGALQKKMKDETTSKEDKAKMLVNLKTKRGEMQKLAGELRKVMMNNRKGMQSKMMEQISVAVAEVAKSKNIDLVFQKYSLAYAANQIEITEDVIAKLKQDLK